MLWNGLFPSRIEKDLVALLLGHESFLVPLAAHHRGPYDDWRTQDKALLLGEASTNRDGTELDVVLHKTTWVDRTAAQQLHDGQDEIQLGKSDRLLRRINSTFGDRGRIFQGQNLEFLDVRVNEPIAAATFEYRPPPGSAAFSLPKEVTGSAKDGSQLKMSSENRLWSTTSLSIAMESNTISGERRDVAPNRRAKSTSRTLLDVEATGRLRYEHIDSASPKNNIFEVSDGDRRVIRDSSSVESSKWSASRVSTMGHLMLTRDRGLDFLNSFYDWSERRGLTERSRSPQIGDPEVVGGETVDVLQWVQARSDRYGIPFRFEVKRAFFRRSDGLPCGKSFFTSENIDGVETVTRRTDKVTSLIRNPALDPALFAVDKKR